jgi:hypothetical protein
MSGTSSGPRSRKRGRATLSIPQWAEHAGLAEPVAGGSGARLADDGRSIATARRLLAMGQGPKLTEVRRRTSNGTVAADGITPRDHKTWARKSPWGRFLSTAAAVERDRERRRHQRRSK